MSLFRLAFWDISLNPLDMSLFRIFLIFGVCCGAPFSLLGQLVAPSEALSPDEQKEKFRLPEGFEIQLVLSEPLIGQPMNLNFDAQGRLWVTSSLEYPFPARGDLDPRGRFSGLGDHEPRDFLVVAEGIGADGKPRKVTRFAEGLNIPIGQTPLGDGSEGVVHSIPNIWRVVDRDGDGKAEIREKLYGSFGNADTHGMVSSLTPWVDGWVYGCHGFSNSSSVKDGSGRVTEMRSGNTYRFRPDGSRFEQVTWGQVNPFGLCFDSLGNAYDADCHSKPVTMLLRGAYYSSFGKPHDGLGYGPNMIDHNHGSSGICGVAYYDADYFPQEYRGDIFLCNPVTGKVHRDKLRDFGSTRLVDTQPDFIACDDPWFRPVDVQLGPDGALYIADFYNAIIGHYEVKLDHPKRDREHGRVWRIVRKEVKPPAIANLTKLDDAGLAAKLGDMNLLIRTLATNLLVARGKKVVEVLTEVMNEKSATPKSLAHGAWALERLGMLDDRRFEDLRRNENPLVRVHLGHILGERKALGNLQKEWVSDFLDDEDAFVRRAAADTAGRHPAVEYFAPLLKAWTEAVEKDTHLVHVVRIALRDLLGAGCWPAEPWTHAGNKADDLLTIATVTVGGHAPQAALKYLEEVEDAGTELTLKTVDFVSGRVDASDLVRVGRSLDERAGDDISLRLRLQRALWQGTKRRGQEFPEELGALSERLVRQWIKTGKRSVLSWTPVPIGGNLSENPWTKETRRCVDSRDSVMLSSLPKGEKLVGLYRSRPFTIPDRLSFYIAGHRGSPGNPPHEKNFVSLRLAEDDTVLFRVFPPRNDVARKVDWNLKDHAGKQGVLELTDGDAGGGYAWLAIGRIEPTVAELEFNAITRQDALHLAADLKLVDLFDPLLALLISAGESTETRLVALASCRRLDEERTRPVARQLVADVEQPSLLRSAMVGWLGTGGSEDVASVHAAFAAAPERLQEAFASNLVTSKQGAEILLVAMEHGKASARLLHRKGIRELLLSSGLREVEIRLKRLTTNLPDGDEQLGERVRSRSAGFRAAKTSLSNGSATFAKYCAACHRIGGKGAEIGPDLDGVSVRGVERLLEDLIDPSRNVDPAFRQTSIVTKDGGILSGIVIEVGNETLEVRDVAGKVTRVPFADVAKKVASSNSLMPQGLDLAISETELYDLLAFLLAGGK